MKREREEETGGGGAEKEGDSGAEEEEDGDREMLRPCRNKAWQQAWHGK